VKYKVVLFHLNEHLYSALPIQIVITAREVTSPLNYNLITEYAIGKPNCSGELLSEWDASAINGH
jgi:hypothetical protein